MFAKRHKCRLGRNSDVLVKVPVFAYCRVNTAKVSYPRLRSWSMTYCLVLPPLNETLATQNVDHDQVDADLLKWKTTRRNLAFANTALSISSAQRFVHDENTSNSKTSVSP